MKREEAEAALATITEGFNKRRAALDGEIAAYFKDAQQEDADMGALVDALVALKDRVELHKAREELKEKKLRIQQARAKHAAENVLQESAGDDDDQQQSPCEPNEATGEICGQEKTEEEEFEPISAEDFEDDDDETNENEATPVAEAKKKSKSLAVGRVVNMVELTDGTRVSLPEYLRMDHRVAQKKNRYGIHGITAYLPCLY